MKPTPLKPETLAGFQHQLSAARAAKQRIVVCGRQSRLQIDDLENTMVLSTERYSGIVDHQASDFTITVLAGTPMIKVMDVLNRAGQFLPFDPVFTQRGATVGGTVAAGLNGPCRMRFGGLRDFVIGCQFLDGHGTAIRAGGKVVKNAAGFDLPKFLVGSAGRFGILLEVTFKVFPKPRCFQTFRFEVSGLAAAVEKLQALERIHPFDALEISESHSVFGRLSGDDEMTLARQREKIEREFSASYARLVEEDDRKFWEDLANFQNLKPEHALVKVPVRRGQIVAFQQLLEELGVATRFSSAGNVAIFTCPRREIRKLDEVLGTAGYSGQVITGTPANYLIGHVRSLPFLNRVKSALDPEGLFGPIHRRSVEIAS